MKRIAICAALALFATAARTQAETIVNKANTNTCLADKNGGYWYPAVIWSRNGNSDQNWTEQVSRIPWAFSMLNASGPGCLGPYSASDPGTSGDSLYMMDCGRQFLWVRLDAGAGCYYYATLNSYLAWATSGGAQPLLVMGVAGAKNGTPPPSGKAVILWNWTGEENQKWCPQQ
jgi:hypothetical protein